MAKTAHYYTQFEPECFYHVYNRSVDKQPLFRSDRNYSFFLQKYHAYLSPVVDTYAYCLLGNHFHILLRVKSLSDLTTFEKLSNLSSSKIPHELVSHQFKKFFQSYAMAYNKEYDRVGTLFQTPFKRVMVDQDSYFTQLVYYIHANPQSHGLISDFREWQWSSYSRILLNKPSQLKKEEVIDWFGNLALYQKYHGEWHQMHLRNDIKLEDF